MGDSKDSVSGSPSGGDGAEPSGGDGDGEQSGHDGQTLDEYLGIAGNRAAWGDHDVDRRKAGRFLETAPAGLESMAGGGKEVEDEVDEGVSDAVADLFGRGVALSSATSASHSPGEEASGGPLQDQKKDFAFTMKNLTIRSDWTEVDPDDDEDPLGKTIPPADAADRTDVDRGGAAPAAADSIMGTTLGKDLAAALLGTGGLDLMQKPTFGTSSGEDEGGGDDDEIEDDDEEPISADAVRNGGRSGTESDFAPAPMPVAVDVDKIVDEMVLVPPNDEELDADPDSPAKDSSSPDSSPYRGGLGMGGQQNQKTEVVVRIPSPVKLPLPVPELQQQKSSSSSSDDPFKEDLFEAVLGKEAAERAVRHEEAVRRSRELSPFSGESPSPADSPLLSPEKFLRDEKEEIDEEIVVEHEEDSLSPRSSGEAADEDQYPPKDEGFVFKMVPSSPNVEEKNDQQHTPPNETLDDGSEVEPGPAPAKAKKQSEHQPSSSPRPPAGSPSTVLQSDASEVRVGGSAFSFRSLSLFEHLGAGDGGSAAGLPGRSELGGGTPPSETRGGAPAVRSGSLTPADGKTTSTAHLPPKQRGRWNPNAPPPLPNLPRTTSPNEALGRGRPPSEPIEIMIPPTDEEESRPGETPVFGPGPIMSPLDPQQLNINEELDVPPDEDLSRPLRARSSAAPAAARPGAVQLPLQLPLDRGRAAPSEHSPRRARSKSFVSRSFAQVDIPPSPTRTRLELMNIFPNAANIPLDRTPREGRRTDRRYEDDTVRIQKTEDPDDTNSRLLSLTMMSGESPDVASTAVLVAKDGANRNLPGESERTNALRNEMISETYVYRSQDFAAASSSKLPGGVSRTEQHTLLGSGSSFPAPSSSHVAARPQFSPPRRVSSPPRQTLSDIRMRFESLRNRLQPGEKRDAPSASEIFRRRLLEYR